MTLLLVRHAVALRRSEWRKPDHLRPLSPRGYQQAEALPGVLAGFAVDRILSSPSLRCVETIQPLAARLGLPVEEVPQLGEGADASAATLPGGLAGLGSVVVLCSHGDVIPALLDVLAPEAAAEEGEELRCAKGSTWILADGGGARYLPPPA